MKLPTDTENLFSALRQSAKPKPVSAIEKLIHDAPDRELCRINALAFADRHGLDEDDVLAAFLHGARLGVFDMSWNILCPASGALPQRKAARRCHFQPLVRGLPIRESRIGVASAMTVPASADDYGL